MKRTFMVGVAAGALLAGLNIASAQSSMERQPAATSSGGGASMEQKGSVEQKGSGGAEMKAQSGEKAKGQQTAQDKEKPSKAQAQDKDGMKGQKQAQDKDRVKGEKKAQKADSKKQGAESESTKSGTSAQSDTKSGSSTSAQSDKSSGGAQASLTTEQKTKIRETVIRSSNAPRVTNVNFSVRVGTVVPRTVRFVALPPILIDIYPQWRGYHYFIVEEEIVIIDPRTLRIIAIINV